MFIWRCGPCSWRSEPTIDMPSGASGSWFAPAWERAPAEFTTPKRRGTMRSMLCKLDALHGRIRRLSWAERVAQLQTGGSYSQWLSQEVATALSTSSSDDGAECAFNAYSTHPSMQDRLCALSAFADQGASGSFSQNSSSGLELLADPDGMAGQLIAKIHRILAAEEQEDTARL